MDIFRVKVITQKGKIDDFRESMVCDSSKKIKNQAKWGKTVNAF